MRRSSAVFLVIAAIALLLLGGRAFTALFVNKAWFAALNAEPVFWEQVQDTIMLRGGLFAAGTLFAFLNLLAVRLTIKEVAVPSRVADLDITATLSKRELMTVTAVMAVIIGLLVAMPFDDWTQVAMARHGIPFREIEFYFQRDLGHYVYWLPLEQTLYVWALLALVVVVGVVIVLYALMRSIRMSGRRPVASVYARRHLTVLGSLMMLMLAWSYRLDGFDLLRYGSGNDSLFLRMDHIIAVKVDFGLTLLIIFSAMLLLRAGWAGQARMATVTLGVVIIATIGVRHGFPLFMARSDWLGEPGNRERDYIYTRALVTRRAYDVDGMVVVSSDSSSRKTSGVQLRDLPRVVSIWDAAVLGRTIGANAQGNINVGPIAWTPGENTLQGLLLQRPAQGDGAWTMVTVSGTAADDRGAPIPEGIELGYHVDSSSLNVVDDVSAGIIASPLIAPGATGHRLIVDSTTRVVGARLASTSSRIAHAWATRDPRLFSAADGGVVPTLVMWRDVRERVRKLAPIFAQGDEVIPLVHDGALYWTIDLYSASDMYPLSSRQIIAGDERSYFRHAATALVHSRTGRVQLITVDKPDPIASTWMAIAPNLFRTTAGMSPALLSQLPAPTEGTLAQARAFSRYGSRADGPIVRHLPDSIFGMDNPPGILLEGRQPAAGWTMPILNGPEQIAGLIISAGGAERGTRWMPVNKLDTRWGTITERLRAALDSSRQGLVDNGRREPQTALGRVRIILVNGEPVALQPLYVTRLNQAQAIARVGVYFQGNVAVGTSEFDAVRQLLGPGPGSASNGAGPSNVPYSAAARQATVNRLYDTMRAAMRRGDWARFGTAFDSLGLLLGRPPQ